MRSSITLAAMLALAACHKPDVQPDSPVHEPEQEAEPVTVNVVTEHPQAEALRTPTLIFTAGIHGYTEPCGCTQDLVYGGIDRVVATALSVAREVPASLTLDAGGLLFETETLHEVDRPQELRKTEVILAAAQAMHVAATVPSPSDLANGLAFYLEQVSAAEIEILASNVTTVDGLGVGVPDARYPLGDATVHVIGATASDMFSAHNEVVSHPAADAIQPLVSDEDDVTVVLFYGDIADARRDLATLTGVDFIVIGEPRHTDEVEVIGSAHTVEAYDQGRYLGRLALFGPSTAGDYVNARPGSAEEIARLERIMAGIERQLAELPIPEGEEPPPIVVRQQERLAELAAERDAMASGELAIPVDGPGFYYEPIAMDLAIPGDPMIHAEMLAFNAELREINLSAPAVEVAPVPEGQAHFVGDQECAQCHFEEMAAWRETAHAHAYATLEDRDKAFDRSCVGCHVTGFEAPGGSLLTDMRGLENVQCEQCHGAGSAHIVNPMATRNTPDGVHAEVPVATCQQCHNAIHSPTFDDATYRPQLLMPGHGLPRP